MLFAYVGWVDKGVPQIYFTQDEVETETGLVGVELEVKSELYDVSPEYRDTVNEALRQRLLQKWALYAHLHRAREAHNDEAAA